jgi:hypothetical protein
VGIFVWISRPFPQPKVFNTSQITHDGVPKQNGILTDGSRLLIIDIVMQSSGFLTILLLR